MTTMASEGLIDAMVAAFKASNLLAGATIYDGPEIDSSDPNVWIAVGHDGTEDGEVIAVTSKNEYKALGAKSMFEEGYINCVLDVWNGDVALSPLRSQARTYISAIDTVIRTDPSFGGVVLWSGLDSQTVSYSQTGQGAEVKIVFTVYYKART